MGIRGIILALAAMLAPAAVLAAEADFPAYPAQVYKGPMAAPKPSAAQRLYRTRLREAAAEGVKFGGRFALSVIGCGAGCRLGYVIDLRSGQVRDLPVGGEDYPDLLVQAHPDSRLLKTQWTSGEACALEDFVWSGQGFRSLGRRTAARCPDWGDVP